MREKTVEDYLVKRMKEVGGKSLKFHSSTEVGFPDRICIFPSGRLYWVELKRPKGKVRKIQELRHKQLRELKQEVAVLSSKDEVDNFMGGNVNEI